MKKKLDQEYIAEARKRVSKVLEDKKEYDDWTQICFSMKDAVEIAADVWGMSSDEEVNKIYKFFQSMAHKEIENIQTFDIIFKKK